MPTVGVAPRRAGLGIHHRDAIEVNQTFAGQLLTCRLKLGIDPGGW